jgi:serine/threonine-protein kinase
MTPRSSLPEIVILDQTTCDQCGEQLDVSEFALFTEISCPFCDHQLRVPGLFDQKLVLQEIRYTADRTVFLAYNENTRRLEELCFIHERLETRLEESRFLKNAEAATRLLHPNLQAIYSYGVENGSPYAFMGVTEGTPLGEYIDPESPQDELGCLEVMLQICRGLSVAEAAGVLHGDIKPSVIRVKETGEAILTDFALSRFSAGFDPRIQGTPLYIAPEKANREWADFRSDQFSLAATFWHVLSGYPPFRGETAPEVVRARYQNSQPDIRNLAPHISSETSLLLQNMMALEPRHRFPSFRDVEVELDLIIGELEERLLTEEQYREELEFEAHQLYREQVKNRIIMVGCVFFLFIAGYFFLRALL